MVCAVAVAVAVVGELVWFGLVKVGLFCCYRHFSGRRQMFNQRQHHTVEEYKEKKARKIETLDDLLFEFVCLFVCWL